jgi:hypothetical protein
LTDAASLHLETSKFVDRQEAVEEAVDLGDPQALPSVAPRARLTLHITRMSFNYFPFFGFTFEAALKK